jgi:hypothetical protein
MFESAAGRIKGQQSLGWDPSNKAPNGAGVSSCSPVRPRVMASCQISNSTLGGGPCGTSVGHTYGLAYSNDGPPVGDADNKAD